MKNQRLTFAIQLAAILSCSSVALAQSKVATTAAPFLGIGVGSKAVAMGGAYTAMADDATALYWNPAGAALHATSQMAFTRVNWLVSSTLNWAGVTIALSNDDVIGLQLTHLDYGESEVTTIAFPDGDGNRWSAYDLAAGLTYARNLTDRFSIGGTFKYIHQKIWNESATAFAFDFGLIYTTRFNGMRIGMNIANFGTQMQLDGKDLIRQIDIAPELNGNNRQTTAKLRTDAWTLPLLFRVGVAMNVIKTEANTIALAVDALYPNDNDESINVGAEYGFQNTFFLRGGYKSLVRANSEEGATFGVGLNYKLTNLVSASVDYAYESFGIFDNIQKFSLAIRF